VWGLSAETGINCENFKVEVEPEINEWVPGVDGQATGKVVGDPRARLRSVARSKGSTGSWPLCGSTAFVPANSVTYFGRSAGGWYLDEGSVANMRGAQEDGRDFPASSTSPKIFAVSNQGSGNPKKPPKEKELTDPKHFKTHRPAASNSSGNGGMQAGLAGGGRPRNLAIYTRVSSKPGTD
jgi:hypothetical protein